MIRPVVDLLRIFCGIVRVFAIATVVPISRTIIYLNGTVEKCNNRFCCPDFSSQFSIRYIRNKRQLKLVGIAHVQIEDLVFQRRKIEPVQRPHGTIDRLVQRNSYGVSRNNFLEQCRTENVLRFGRTNDLVIQAVVGTDVVVPGAFIDNRGVFIHRSQNKFRGQIQKDFSTEPHVFSIQIFDEMTLDLFLLFRIQLDILFRCHIQQIFQKNRQINAVPVCTECIDMPVAVDRGRHQFLRVQMSMNVQFIRCYLNRFVREDHVVDNQHVYHIVKPKTNVVRILFGVVIAAYQDLSARNGRDDLLHGLVISRFGVTNIAKMNEQIMLADRAVEVCCKSFQVCFGTMRVLVIPFFRIEMPIGCKPYVFHGCVTSFMYVKEFKVVY